MVNKIAAAFLAATSWPALAGSDNPMADGGSGGDSGLVGLAVMVLAYGVWRLFVNGDLWALVAGLARFVAFIYMPVLGVLGSLWLSFMGLRAFGIEKGTAGLLALALTVIGTWLCLNASAKKGDPGPPPGK